MRATDARCCCQLLSMNINFHRAATHAFDKTLVNTVVQENANPIEKVERTALLMASTTHGEDPASLVHHQHAERVACTIAHT